MTLQVKSYADRAVRCTNPLAQRLLNLMQRKQTNLAFAADVNTCHELLDVRTACQFCYLFYLMIMPLLHIRGFNTLEVFCENLLAVYKLHLTYEKYADMYVNRALN